MARYRRESKLDGNQVPKSLEVKVKSLNDDWRRIASLTADLFDKRVRSPRKVVEDSVIVEENVGTVQAEAPLTIVEDWKEGTQIYVCHYIFFSLLCFLLSWFSFKKSSVASLVGT